MDVDNKQDVSASLTIPASTKTTSSTSRGSGQGFLSKQFPFNDEEAEATDGNNTTESPSQQQQPTSIPDDESASPSPTPNPNGYSNTDVSVQRPQDTSERNENKPPYRTCGIKINATRDACSSRIEAASNNIECDCYNFCGDLLVGCTSFDDPPSSYEPTLSKTCPIQSTLVGCQSNQTLQQQPPAPPIQLRSVNEPCPPGYLCSRYGQTSCDLVRKIPPLMGLGDIHAGIYCPGRPDRIETGYQNCDAGYYCPNSTTRIPCPKGYYCPHKTAKPEIKCPGCVEGAATMQQDLYAYTLLVIGIVLMMVVVLVKVFRRYNLYSKLKLRRLQSRNVDGLKNVSYKRKHLKKLKELKPKLKAVEKRLRKRYGGEVRTSLVIASETEDGKVIFKGDAFFDALDRQKVGELTYEELNEILGLSKVQLREFAHRMNEAAGELPDTKEVERHVFITQFLGAFEAVCHLEPDYEEAAQMFDDIAKQGTAANGEVPHRLFYTSPLGDFLEDVQINALLKDFQRTKEMHEGDEFEQKIIPPPPKNRDKAKQPPVVPTVYRQSILGLSEKSDTIGREEFVARYPKLLHDVTHVKKRDQGSLFTSQLSIYRGIDLSFKGLTVAVKVKDRSVKVVQNLRGRLHAGTMTAVMGPAGAGKATLINALCGRSFTGNVTGDVWVNGNRGSLQQHSTAVGFVPKENIVYEELTVRENLIFSGRFRLPEGTPLVEIEDLADATMANLNVLRIMHAVVGNPRYNGLDCLQRRRVSLGMEMMAKPQILFLQKASAGLDSSATLKIIQSLKKLSDTQGTTICVSLDECRRDAFELFDSLLLLGGGGKMVYHGPVAKVGKYFNGLNYYLPAGESLTDWIIDISAGRLAPPVKRRSQGQKGKDSLKQRSWDNDSKTTKTTAESSSGTPRVKRVTFAIQERTASGSDERENLAGSSTKPFDNASEQAKATYELLNENWMEYYKKLTTKKKKARYEAPTPYNLPRKKTLPPFMDQLGFHLQRLLILMERKWLSRFADTTLLVVAVILIALMDGVVKPTRDLSMASLSYDNIAEPASMEALVREFPKLFAYAFEAIRGDITASATKIGLLFALIVAITASKSITTWRQQYVREAGGDFSVNAYFLSLNIATTFDHSFRAVIVSLAVLCIRNSLSSWYSYIVNFLMLSWISASWGLFIPLLVKDEHAYACIGVFVTFFGLLFCGAISPISFEAIYDGVAAAIASGILSPTRFFVETMAVAEARSLPAQSGFTNFGPNFQGEALKTASFNILHYGQNDFNEVTNRSSGGWYWGALPSLFVGLLIRWAALGILHVSNRAREARKPMQRLQKTSRMWLCLYLLVLAALIAVSCTFILRDAT